MKLRGLYFRNDETSNAPTEPGNAPVVEEIVPVVVAEPVSPPKPPRSNEELFFEFGRMVDDIDNLKKQVTNLEGILRDFEVATVSAIETVEAENEQQSEVIDEIAAQVLPADNEEAVAHNPEHSKSKANFWELFFGGHHHGEQD